MKEGMVAFNQLEKEFPKDGMLFYERAEAHEYRKEENSAIYDFKKAEELFPFSTWKQVARIGLIRVSENRHRFYVPPKVDQWEAFHQVHMTPNIPNNIRINALTAIEIFNETPGLSVAIFRICLEQLLIIILNKSTIEYSCDENINELVNKCIGNKLISPRFNQVIMRIKRFGNEGIHPDGITKDT